MNLVELDRALRQLRLSGMAAVLDTRLRQAQTEKMAPIDLISALVADELHRRQDRLLDHFLHGIPSVPRELPPVADRVSLPRPWDSAPLAAAPPPVDVVR